MKQYEYTLAITVKDAAVEDILELVEKLRGRLGRVVVQTPPSALEQPKRAIAEYYTDKKKQATEELKKRVIEALEKAGGNQEGAARLVGVSPETFRRWTVKLGLRSPRQLRRALSS